MVKVDTMSNGMDGRKNAGSYGHNLMESYCRIQGQILEKRRRQRKVDFRKGGMQVEGQTSPMKDSLKMVKTFRQTVKRMRAKSRERAAAEPEIFSILLI
jgi:hypothetical protein